MMKKTIGAVLLFSLLGGCASTTEEADINTTLTNGDDVPAWVFSPVEENGLASASCVAWSGNMQVDRAQVIAEARADLVQQIQARVAIMDKSYSRKNTSEEGISTGGVFERVSKQVAQKNITGAIPKHVSFATIDGAKQLCGMVALNQDKTQQLFDTLVKESGSKVDPQSKAALYEEFRAKKAQEELEAELEKLQ